MFGDFELEHLDWLLGVGDVVDDEGAVESD